jgi:hypothetical protein
MTSGSQSPSLPSRDNPEGSTYHICTVYLPEEEEKINSRRMYGQMSKLWKNKESQVIEISLFGSDDYELLQERERKIKAAVNEISQYISLSFKFLAFNDNSAIVRISFVRGQGAWSAVGIDVLAVRSGKPTMNLGWIDDVENDSDGTIKHEFCHTLGFEHEHQHPDHPIQWDYMKVLDYYKRHHGWDERTIYHNILMRFSYESTNSEYFGLPYDPLSIMHYPVPAELTLNGKEYKRSKVLSPQDILTLKKAYPKPRRKIEVEDFSKLKKQVSLMNENIVLLSQQLNRMLEMQEVQGNINKPTRTGKSPLRPASGDGETNADL